MQDLRAELAETLDEAEWNWLAPHADQERVIVVSPELDLLDVGVAIANDNVGSVQRWIDERLVYKPSIQQRNGWGVEEDKRFKALIVQPYVLIQEPL